MHDSSRDDVEFLTSRQPITGIFTRWYFCNNGPKGICSLQCTSLLDDLFGRPSHPNDKMRFTFHRFYNTKLKIPNSAKKQPVSRVATIAAKILTFRSGWLFSKNRYDSVESSDNFIRLESKRTERDWAMLGSPRDDEWAGYSFYHYQLPLTSNTMSKCVQISCKHLWCVNYQPYR